MECAYSKNRIDESNSCVCADGFTYDKRVIIPYIRKYKKSPITHESLNLESVIYNKKSKMNELVLDKIRENLDEYIGILKMSHNFSKIPLNEYSIQITKLGEKYRVDIIFENIIEDSKKESLIKHIKYELIACHIKIYSIPGNYYTVYLHHTADGHYLSIHAKRMIELNERIKTNGYIEIESMSSFTKENQAKRWLDDVFVEDFVSNPIKLILETQTENYVVIPTKPEYELTHLNNEQKSIFEDMRELIVISGPPGTGKTTVISTAVEYIQGPKSDNDYTIVLSEKNKAISAISEKFRNKQYKKIVAFGVTESMDLSTTRYLIDNKIYYDESVLSIYENMNKLIIEANQKTKKLRRICYKSFKRYQLYRFSWTDLSYIRYQISLKNFGRNFQYKIDLILQDLSNLFEAYEKYQQNFKFALESARQCVKNDANILLTTFGSIHKVFDFLKEKNEISSKFTFIIDEASTVEAWKVLYLEKYVNDLNGHLKQLILIGDTKQLSVFFPNGTNDEKESILDILDSRQTTHHLTSTYRCPQKIVDLMNKNFYKKTLKVGHTRTIENAIAWIHSEGVDENEFDYHEIGMIRKTIIKFTNIDNSILILSPYKKQVELLRSMIVTYGIQNTNVSTIDKSQGNEADVVILSLVKSNPTSFLTKRRSNVMISRTRDKLIVFGNRNNALTSSNAVLRSLAKNSGYKNLES